MKEIMAIIRQDKINKTKEALLKTNFPGITVRKVLGRGKKLGEFYLTEETSEKAYKFTNAARLMPKRLITIVIKDEQVEEAIQIIIKINKSNHIGDGKIFVLPILESYRIRDEKSGSEVI